MTDTQTRAHAFLAGEQLSFAEADGLWKALRGEHDLSLARAVLARIHAENALIDSLPADCVRNLRREEALLTSKDSELGCATRHDRALEVLAKAFDIDSPGIDGDAETLGIAGGIYKRRWVDLGQTGDLIRAARMYSRGAAGSLGQDAYAHINAAFLEDLLAELGDDAEAWRQRASALRERIVNELPVVDSWWNAATRAEALLGLGRVDEATQVLVSAKGKKAPWELETTARQLAKLAQLRCPESSETPQLKKFFDALLPGAADAAQSVTIGKVGLALSGGGFRASFYHLGVLARLAELDVLRHVEVLSCVSGGSIVGACYWLALRRMLSMQKPPAREDYVDLVKNLIAHFDAAVATNLRGVPSKLKVVWRLFNDEKGALDPEATAKALHAQFYRPLLPGSGPLYMDELAFTPADHDPTLAGPGAFHPGLHNWMRAHKVPVLVLNATTVNTGHAWQFTPTWMGESPWSVHEAADSVPRLEWSWYQAAVGWRIELGRAVAASACVPGIFAPLEIKSGYDGIDVQLVDGGVHDNQGIVSLLALNCNVLMVSDAAGQLLFQRSPSPGLKGLGSYAVRSMDTLMERVRLANFADLSARRRSGLLRGLMFLHMKAGLDADPIRLTFSQESYDVRRAVLSPSGVRKDFQQALAELRTDLDAFTPIESLGLMACGYQMACKSFQRNLSPIKELWREPVDVDWPFKEMLAEITSTAATTPHRAERLDELRAGNKVKLG